MAPSPPEKGEGPQKLEHAWAHDLCRPLPLIALGLLVLNDHVVKSCLFVPALVRGKLSDVAGLFFFPVLLFALVELAARGIARRHREAVVGWCALATAIAFATLKTCPAANALAGRLGGHLVFDPTDLAALPAVFAAGWWMRRRVPLTRRPSPAWARAMVVAIAVLAAAATSAPRQIRRYPEWRIVDSAEQDLGCARARVWVSKTGKEGVGLTVRLSASAACGATVRAASFVLDGVAHAPTSLPASQTLSEAQGPFHLYLAFPFDGEAAWNRGARVGTFTLTFAVGPAEGVRAEREFSFSAKHHLDSFHTDRLQASSCK